MRDPSSAFSFSGSMFASGGQRKSVTGSSGTAWAVLGLGFGAEGKGTVVDFLVRQTDAKAVVRWNGGPQAAHHVVTAEGHVHCFSQFGSGSLVTGTETLLAREMLVDPLALLREENALQKLGVTDSFKRLVIDPRCRIVLPIHKLINQMREISRAEQRHGSSGRGVGEAVWDSENLGEKTLVAADLLDLPPLREKLRTLWELKTGLAEDLVKGSSADVRMARRLQILKRLEFGPLAARMHEIATSTGLRITKDICVSEYLTAGSNLVFEGAHGALLDRERGFFPHVTNADTTFGGVTRLLTEAIPAPPPIRPKDKNQAKLPLKRVGVLRAYATRHGAGPLVTEDRFLAADIPDIHNEPNEWQGPPRSGWLDLVALRYGVRASGGVDALAITSLDRLSGVPVILVATGYTVEGVNSRDVTKLLQPSEMQPPAFSAVVPEPGGKRRVRVLTRAIRLARQKDVERQRELTQLLASCRPVFRQFPGWSEDISTCRTVQDLPYEARSFLSFLESEEGLGVPIALVSVGPTADDKIVLNQEALRPVDPSR